MHFSDLSSLLIILDVVSETINKYYRRCSNYQWGCKQFDSYFLLFACLRHKLQKRGGRRRTLRRQIPTSSLYKLIINSAKFLYQTLLPIIASLSKNMHRCISNSRRAHLILYPCKYVRTASTFFDRATHTYQCDVFKASSGTQQ